MTRPRPPRRGAPPVVTPNPPAPNMGGLGALAAILTLPKCEVLAGARGAAATRRHASWALSLYLVRIDTDALFAPAYRSTTAWGVAELGMRSSSVSKYLQAGRLLLTLPADQQRAVMQVGPSTAYETGLLRLAKRAPAKAAALARTAPTQRALRTAVDRIAPKAKRPAPIDLTRQPDGLRWAVAVIGGTRPFFALEVGDGRRTERRELDADGLADELLRLADAVGIRALLEARLRRRAA